MPDINKLQGSSNPYLQYQVEEDLPTTQPIEYDSNEENNSPSNENDNSSSASSDEMDSLAVDEQTTIVGRFRNGFPNGQVVIISNNGEEVTINYGYFGLNRRLPRVNPTDNNLSNG